MSWTLNIDRLAASGIIGIHPWEREQQQTLYISLQLEADLQAAAEQDNIELTLNYSELAERVRKLVTEANAKLIEHLAKRIGDDLLQRYNLLGIEVRVDKPDAVTAAASTSVTYRVANQSDT